MEEQKKAKKVTLGVVENNEEKEQPKKLTYEQLNQACMELSQQNQQMTQYIQRLRQQIGEMRFDLQTKRMDYLFKVVELYSEHLDRWQLFDDEFVHNCAKEIQESLTIPEQPDIEEEK